jgi:fructosamine-3-kinase
MSFNFNQLENECRRNKMMFEKEVDNLTLLIKENSTQVPNNYSRVTEN